MNRLDRIRGCLLGGAVGDALGAPVEFMAWADIKAGFGEGGISDFASAYGAKGAVTDDGLNSRRAAAHFCSFGARGVCHLPWNIHHALLCLQAFKSRGATWKSLHFKPPS